ncbi:MAG: CehA/McbA family metallohydrolase [Lewinellaceae bacterium]|nr:CehA/McbA family metallohydrolase [Phaeodactylibacter sp.]MCB9346664.1 CehA/McbA family metallohydrolase [Lewinellaceae bacterium]
MLEAPVSAHLNPAITKSLCYWALSLALFACNPGQKEAAPPTPKWYKGNTHSHTVLCGHADSTPEAVARWYHDRGYNFLILSEHNIFIDPDSVRLPADKRADFILIPGEEVTGREAIHTTGMNTRRFVPAQLPEGFMNEPDATAREAKRRILQMHVDSVLQAGGAPILNHPNYVSGIHADNILRVRRLHLFELFNGHPDVHNWGNELHASTEQKWDSLLTAGMLIYGVSSDDAHTFQEWSPQNSNPGRGWVMVRSDTLEPGAITYAMEQGDFYATNGIILSDVSFENKQYRVQIDTAHTREELESPFVTGKKDSVGTEGYLIEFIGPGGQVLEKAGGTQAAYGLGNGEAYVRCKLSYTRRNPDGGYEQFFAWAQPWFSDGRDKIAR